MAEEGGYDTTRPTTKASSRGPTRGETRNPPGPESSPPKCRPRIDELAMPSKRLILALYNDHAGVLPKDKLERIKMWLEELYAMSPEDTEAYFEKLKNKAEERERRKEVRFVLKKLMAKKQKAKKIMQAYALLDRLLKRGLEYAGTQPLPPIVSVRLRYLSNIILEQICDLRNCKIPNRENADRVGSFLLRAADWIAIAIEQLYYGVQLKKNAELEQIEKESRKKRKRGVKRDGDVEKVQKVDELYVPDDGEYVQGGKGVSSERGLTSDMEELE